MKTSKVCIVTRQYPPQIGGVGHSAHRIANALANQGLKVHVVVIQKHDKVLPYDESFESAEEGNILVHRVKVYHPPADFTPNLLEQAILTRYNRDIFQVLDYFQNQYRYDLFHAFFLYPAGFVTGMVAKLHQVKFLVSIRGNDVGKYAFDPVRLPFVRSALENADYVTSVATSLLDLADRAITPIGSKSRTIINSVDISKLKPQKKPDLNVSGLVIGSSGLFRYKKGLVYLCKALGQLKDKFDFTLLLTGDYFKEEDRAPHMKWFRENGLKDRVIVTGKIPHDRIADYLRLYDIMVYPSLFSEGCPLSMMEAMATNRAVIGARSGAIPEIIEDRQNGILVNPATTDEIVAAIKELAENVEFRKQLGENAGKTMQKFSQQRELDQWMDVYNKLI